MRYLRELVAVNKQFRKSVNLQLDIGDHVRAGEYIPTESSTAILKEYLYQIQGQSAAGATILIGPYGKGKSHLILVLLTLLGGEAESMCSLLEKIHTIDPELEELIRGFWKMEKPILPVLISPTGKDLNFSFLQALKQALERGGLGALMPEIHYDLGIDRLGDWEHDYPEAFASLQKLLDQEPENTRDALSIYRQVNRRLCQDHGYAGIYLVFDEFSKYIEGHGEENFSKDMRILQDMCELTNNYGEEKLFLTLIAHKSIHEYEKGVPQNVRNAFKGVEGRLKEMRFIVSARNNYALIANSILKKEPLFSKELMAWRREAPIEELLEASRCHPAFHKLFGDKEFFRTMVYGCYPLTPLCAYALLQISEKIAQNERTVFTFLTGEEGESLARLIGKRQAGAVGMDAIYDYFKGVFREARDMPLIHNEWLKADYALQRTENTVERKIVKAVAVIHMIHREDELPAKNETIRLALGLSGEVFQEAMQRLIDREIFLYRPSQAMYTFRNHIGIDIEKELQEEIDRGGGKTSLSETIARVADQEYVIPRRYNQKHAMTRYFRYKYMDPEIFLKLKRSSYLFEEGLSDGEIIALVSETAIEPERIRAHVEKLQEPRLVVLVSKNAFPLRHVVKRLEAVWALGTDPRFQTEHEVLEQELRLYEEDLTFEINGVLERDFLPEGGNTYIIQDGEIFSSFATAAEFNAFLSDILEGYYDHTPRINHELLNIQRVAGQYLRARNQVVQALLKREDCSRFQAGTNPEAMVYRAAFIRTGILSHEYPTDQGCKEMLRQMEAFFVSCYGKSQSFSKLYMSLQGQHFGVRRGILPLFIAYCIFASECVAVVYLGHREMEITADILNRINDFPEQYELYVEPQSAVKEEYLRRMEQAFDVDSISRTGQSRMSRLVQAMQKWYRSLPQYAMTTGNIPAEYVAAARALRSQLKQMEPNPRELLMERLPKAINREGGSEINYAWTVEQIRAVQIKLSRALDELMEQIADCIRKMFLAQEAESIKGCLMRRYSRQSQRARDSILSTTANRVMQCIGGLSTNDEGELLSELAQRVTGLYPADWNDRMLEQFQRGLKAVKEELEGISDSAAGKEGMHQIILKDGEGNRIEKYYSDEVQDTTAAFFKNMIADAMEEFGDTLETNQKVAVLVQTLTELLQ